MATTLVMADATIVAGPEPEPRSAGPWAFARRILNVSTTNEHPKILWETNLILWLKDYQLAC
jgi:hypothetical protein